MISRREGQLRVSISKIIIPERFRVDYGDMDALKDSLTKYQVIHPPVLTRDHVLVAGGRRLRAATELGWEDIEVNFTDEVDPITLREMELEENICRKDFSWPEQCEAKRELHLLKSVDAIKRGERWTLEDTARTIGESLGNLNQDIQLAEAVRDDPELLRIENKTTAFKRHKNKQIEEAKAKLVEHIGVIPVKFERADCLEFLPTLVDNSIDLIITDPQWGIDVDDSASFGSKVEYIDTEKYMKEVMSRAIPELFRVLKSGSHMYMFFGIEHKDWLLATLSFAGFETDYIPGIWNKGSRGAMNSPYRESNSYECYFHSWKGSPNPLAKIVANSHTCPRPTDAERIHTAQKPLALITELLDNSCAPGATVLDCFAGSGVVLKAAQKSGCQGVGCEIDKLTYAKALGYIMDVKP